MTKTEFWGALNETWTKGNMKKFWELWNANPQYIKERHEEFERDMANTNSERRKEHDKWWATLKPKLIDYYGEDWVKEHCKD